MTNASPPQSARPFRFAVQCSAPLSHHELLETAKQAEELGYSALTVPDHFDGQLGPIAALATVAAATSNLRIGSLMFCNDYRHPVVLAKEAATLDVVSDGRFELGIGAGWMTSDYEAAGVELDTPGVRIERMTEAVHIIQGLFAAGPLSYSGEHYKISELEGMPKPVQQPGPPIVIGGGAPRMLRTAGRLADIVGINVNLRSGIIGPEAGRDGTLAQTRKKLSWVAEGAGDRFADIELQARVHLVSVTNDRQALAEALATGFGLSPSEALASPHALVGSVEEMIEDLEQQRDELGITYLGIGADAMVEFAPVVAKLANT